MRQRGSEPIRKTGSGSNTILVTGGTGYLGRALVAGLADSGERVRVLCRAGGRIHSGSSGVEYLSGDVTRQVDLDAAMKGVRLVYHLAALVDHYAAPESLRAVNVQGTLNVVEAAARHGVERVVHCSSVSAEPGGGSTDYGRSKIEAEAALVAWHDRLPIVILRPGPVYDAERRNLRALVRFVRLCRVCPRPWPDIMLHLASRANVTAAFLLAGKAGIPGKAYAICDRLPVMRSVLAGIVAKETGAAQMPLPLPLLHSLLYAFALGNEGLHGLSGIRPRLSRHYLHVLTRPRSYDIAPALSELGYAPAVTESHFTAAVRACRERSIKDAAGEA